MRRSGVRIPSAPPQAEGRTREGPAFAVLQKRSVGPHRLWSAIASAGRCRWRPAHPQPRRACSRAHRRPRPRGRAGAGSWSRSRRGRTTPAPLRGRAERQPEARGDVPEASGRRTTPTTGTGESRQRVRHHDPHHHGGGDPAEAVGKTGDRQSEERDRRGGDHPPDAARVCHAYAEADGESQDESDEDHCQQPRYRGCIAGRLVPNGLGYNRTSTLFRRDGTGRPAPRP